MATMNISLSDELRAVVEARVKAGMFSNASDYVRALIRHDQQKEAKKARLLALLNQAERDVSAGDVIELASDTDIADYFKALRRIAKD